MQSTAASPSLDAAKDQKRTRMRRSPARLARACSPASRLRLIPTGLQAILDPKTSRRIFELARDQQEELDEKDLDDEDEDDTQLDLSAPRGPSLDDDDDLDLDRYEDVEEIEEIVSKADRADYAAC